MMSFLEIENFVLASTANVLPTFAKTMGDTPIPLKLLDKKNNIQKLIFMLY